MWFSQMEWNAMNKLRGYWYKPNLYEFMKNKTKLTMKYRQHHMNIEKHPVLTIDVADIELFKQLVLQSYEQQLNPSVGIWYY